MSTGMRAAIIHDGRVYSILIHSAFRITMLIRSLILRSANDLLILSQRRLAVPWLSRTCAILLSFHKGTG
jgi:hypothetical protein